MAKITSIEYCTSTSNPVPGCNGCELLNQKLGVEMCYAFQLWKRYNVTSGYPNDFFSPGVWKNRIEQVFKWKNEPQSKSKPWLQGYPRIIFWNDTGDSFTSSVPIDWLSPYMEALGNNDQIHLFLTKRPHRMLKFFKQHGSIPSNFWLLTSITSQKTTSRLNYLKKLREVSANVTLGISFEPLLGPIDVDLDGIDWIIVGGESGQGARPMNPNWARSLRDQAKEKNIRFFFKQWGEWLPFEQQQSGLKAQDGHVYDPHELLYFSSETWRYLKNWMGDSIHPELNDIHYKRVGKKKSGRLLDGRQWNELPTYQGYSQRYFHS